MNVRLNWNWKAWNATSVCGGNTEKQQHEYLIIKTIPTKSITTNITDCHRCSVFSNDQKWWWSFYIFKLKQKTQKVERNSFLSNKRNINMKISNEKNQFWFMSSLYVFWVFYICSGRRHLIIWDLPSCTLILKYFVIFFFHYRISFCFIWNGCSLLNVQCFMFSEHNIVLLIQFLKSLSSYIGLRDEVLSLDWKKRMGYRQWNEGHLSECVDILEIFVCENILAFAKCGENGFQMIYLKDFFLR